MMALALLPSVVQAGFYGQNKVQYLSSDWRRLQTSHFDIYFNQEGDSVAHFTAERVEGIYQDLSGKLNHHLFRRIPILLHNSPNHFQETNVIRIPLPEAVGGFTEIFKNRIVLPFAGNWPEFAHVLKHEMVHAMVFDMMRGPGGGAMSIVRRLSGVPLWFSEGLAEWASSPWNIESEFFLIDAVTNGYVPLPTGDMPGYLAYRGGQSFLKFIADNFGAQAIPQILVRMGQGFPLENAFLKVTQVSLEEWGELWIRELRRLYWPELGKRQYAKRISTPMIDHKKDNSYLNATPALSPNGKYLAYASDGGNWEGIFIKDLEKEESWQIVKNGFVSEHESLHLLSSGFHFSPDSRQLVFISQSRGRDVFHIYDLESKKVVLEIHTPYHTLRHPVFSPDGKKLAVSAQSTEGADIVIYDLESKTLEALTPDGYFEDHPAFSPDGQKIAFSTDRFRTPGDTLNPNKLDVVVMDIESRQMTRLTHSRWNSHSPAFDSTGRGLFFISDRTGLNNLWYCEISTGVATPVTDVLSSVESFSYNPQKDQLAYSLFERGGWNIFLMDDAQQLRTDSPDSTYFLEWARHPERPYFRSFEIGLLQSYQQYQKDSLAKIEENLEEEEGEEAHLRAIVQRDSLRLKDSLEYVREAYSDTATEFISDEVVRKEGRYLVTPYEPDWSLDQATVLAGVAGGGGAGVSFGGQALVTFSDLTGDQELQFQLLASGSSFDEIDFFGAYRYLKHQMDYGFYGFHQVSYLGEEVQVDSLGNYLTGDAWADSIFLGTVREIYSDERGNPLDTFYYEACLFDEAGHMSDAPLSEGICRKREYFKDRSFGTGVLFSFPTSRFSRWELGVDYRRIVRSKFYQNTQGGLSDNKALGSKTLDFVHSTLLWTFDNSRWGLVGPMSGGRYGFSFETRTPLDNNESFWVTQADLRHYFLFFRRFAFANRLSGGASGSFGGESSSHQFLLGGDSPFTFNGHINRDGLDGTLQGRYAADLGTPLRGFRYYDFTGRYSALWNFEFRFPFIYQLAMQLPIPLPAPVVFTDIEGVLFSDLGGAWSSGNPWEQMGQGFGWGLRVNLGYIVFRYTKSWTNHSMARYRSGSTDYWSLGAQF